MIWILMRLKSPTTRLFLRFRLTANETSHYSDVIISTMASQITSLTIIYSAVYSGAGQRKHQSSASQAFVRGIHRSPVNSPHQGPVTRKCFDDVIMKDLLHGPLSVESTGDRWFPSYKRPVTRKVFPCHDVITVMAVNRLSLWLWKLSI